MAAPPEIQAVRDGPGWKRFLELAERVYQDQPRYCPPLRLHLRIMAGRLNAPGKLFLLALQDGVVVARLAASRHHDAVHFGFFESLPVGPEPTQALFRAVREHFPDLPLRGPYHFRQEDPYTGLLVKGFDQDPMFFMAYNPPYYEAYLERAGLRPIQDLYSYEVRLERLKFEMLRRGSQQARDRRYSLRSMTWWRVLQEAQAIASLFNAALASNWGYEPLDKTQTLDIVLLTLFFLDPSLVLFAVKEGRDVGCTFLLPDFNPVLRRTRGYLTPSFLWACLRRRRHNRYRGYAIGIHPEHQHEQISSLLVDALMQTGKARSWEMVEISWVLASNRPMNLMAITLGGRRNKVHRLYELPTDASH